MNKEEAVKNLIHEKLEIISGSCIFKYQLVRYIARNKMRRPALVPLTERELEILTDRVIKKLIANGEIAKTKLSSQYKRLWAIY